MKSTIEILRDLRTDHDFSQKDIAGILGISQQHYSLYEKGEYELPLRHFATLAEYYNVSADYLLGRCKYHEKGELDSLFVTRSLSARDFLQTLLSLDERARQSMAEQLYLQKIKQIAEQEKQQT
ncbi:MAG: helix-turn-helix transcriptional regulator [Oscillospiraceae bacterium]|nr:helix-turn-helix transcriptional regulator [Oscillospiraceae bacterium]